MTIRLHKLIVTGPGKEPAQIDFRGESYLVFGPTDTGKSYIVECLRYCLGSNERPRDIGFSEGYSRVALQVLTADDEQFTLFRDLLEGGEAVYSGFHELPPQNGPEPLKFEIGELLISWSHAGDRKILTKSGTLGNLVPGDLRYVSLFDEIETLDKVPLEGKDNILKMRRRSSISLVLSGVDDSQAVLATSTDQRNLAKGHVEALEEQIQGLKADVPEGLTKVEAVRSLAQATAEIERFSAYLQTHAEELAVLKAQRAEIDAVNQVNAIRISALREAQDRFHLLDAKYENDFQRLQAISTAAAIVGSFEARACPLCRTDISHQARHTDEQESRLALRQASQAESLKIVALREGLRQAIDDVAIELKDARESLLEGKKAENVNLAMQGRLLTPAALDLENGLSALSERKSLLAMAVRDLEKTESLEIRLNGMKARAKRQKQVVMRDISQSATQLCSRVKALLEIWGVPGVESVYFDDAVADVSINQRQRISFGKGKRGIFLAAYVVALMEQALSKGHPHLGLITIDSPVVTYKDPKHGSQDSEEALDVGVKDRFYVWLADRDGPGQVIVLENEEPDDSLKQRLLFTEFVGAGEAEGRAGFFPTVQ